MWYISGHYSRNLTKTVLFSIVGEKHIIMDHFDVNCYKKIIEYIESRSLNRKAIIISVSQILIKLMKILETKEDREIVKNGIILAISYFTSLPAHEYNSTGKNISQLSEKCKQIALRHLKDEFLLN